MNSRPSATARLAIAILAIFTVWISWRAKALEMHERHLDGVIGVLHKPAPAFQLQTLDGRSVSLADYRGKKKVVLSFWASWCGPCRMEAPVLRKFYEDHAGSRAEFEILAVNMDEFPGAARDAAAEWKIPFPVLLDSNQKTAAAYEVFSIPTLIVIGRNGNVDSGAIGFSPATEPMLAQWLNLPMTPLNGAPHVPAGH